MPPGDPLPRPLGRGNAARGDPSGVAAARAVEILSHELRSPITTIHLGTKVLRDAEQHLPATLRREVVAAVEEEAERLYRLVEDLLAVARHEGGAAPLVGGPLLLQHWLPGVITAEVERTPALRVRLAVPRELPAVIADDGALVQVIRNLLANAARYASEGMPVEVVAAAGSAGFTELHVLDRGPGVDPAEAERLFEPFYRSRRTTGGGSGAGLGLAAASRLLAAMGGSISAGARPGGGARFVVLLPRAIEDAPGADTG